MTTATLTDKTAVLSLIYSKVWGNDYEPNSGAQPGADGRYKPPRCKRTGLRDSDVLNHCRTDANGEEFTWYYDAGDLANVDDDDSRADWYIFDKLAFYCGADTEQIARLFMAGEHYLHTDDPAKAEERRTKLSTPRPGYASLLLATIAKVLADRGPERIYHKPQADAEHGVIEILTDAQAENLPPLKGIVGDLLFEDSVGVLYAPTGMWKTFLALSWGMSLGHGLPWLVKHDVMQGPVVYICSEGARDIGQRITAWKAANGLIGKHVELYIIPQAVPLMQRESVDRLIEAIVRQLGDRWPRLIVVDTLARAMVGGDENSQKDAELFLSACEALKRRFECCVLLVHHTGWQDGRMRGSSVFGQWVDTSIRMEPVGNKQHLVPGDLVNVVSDKAKSGARFKDFGVTTRVVSWALANDATGTNGDGTSSSLVIDNDRFANPFQGNGQRPTAPPFTWGAIKAWDKLAILEHAHPNGTPDSVWQTAVMAGGVSDGSYKNYKRKLRDAGWIEQLPSGTWRVSVPPQPAQTTTGGDPHGH